MEVIPLGRDALKDCSVYIWLILIWGFPWDGVTQGLEKFMACSPPLVAYSTVREGYSHHLLTLDFGSLFMVLWDKAMRQR